jgi:hypothetical protein
MTTPAALALTSCTSRSRLRVATERALVSGALVIGTK